MRSEHIGSVSLAVLLLFSCADSHDPSGREAAPSSGDSSVRPQDATVGDRDGNADASPDAAAGSRSDAASDDNTPPGVKDPDHDVSACARVTPIAGAPCELHGLRCTYGDSIRADCRDRWECVLGSWHVEPTCGQPPAGFCPPAPREGECSIESEDPSERICAFDDGTLCTCSLCGEGSCWKCVSPPAEASCPPRTPNIGEPCDAPGTVCEYGDPCQGGSVRACRKGHWYPRWPFCQD